MLSESWAAARLPALLGTALVQKGEGICPLLVDTVALGCRLENTLAQAS